MLIEEAEELIKNELECVNRNVEENCNRMCSDCDLVRGAAEIKQAYQMAILALEKQIPKKPIKIDHWRLCPNCFDKNGFSYDYLVGMKQRDHENISYCLGCGQAIDWSDKV